MALFNVTVAATYMLEIEADDITYATLKATEEMTTLEPEWEIVDISEE